MECHEDATAVQTRKALDLDSSLHTITLDRQGHVSRMYTKNLLIGMTNA